MRTTLSRRLSAPLVLALALGLAGCGAFGGKSKPSTPTVGKRVPILVKIAPDLSENDIDAAGRVLGDLRVDGVIATNTTVARDGVEDSPLATEAGGLSGAPLMSRATTVLRMLRTRLRDDIPIIGVGGILHGADAATKQAAGAVLVQTSTGLIYRGPALIGECVDALRRRKEAPSRGTLPLV